MKAGRELDALVAEKVMGLMKEVRIKGETNHMTIYTNNPYFSDGQCSKDELLRYAMPLHYSTDIADAWQAVEKLGMVTIENATPHGPWSVGFTAHDCEGEPHWVHVEADTAPLAICLAALKACGVEVEKR